MVVSKLAKDIINLRIAITTTITGRTKVNTLAISSRQRVVDRVIRVTRGMEVHTSNKVFQINSIRMTTTQRKVARNGGVDTKTITLVITKGNTITAEILISRRVLEEKITQ